MPVVASRTTADAGAGNLPAGASAAVPPCPFATALARHLTDGGVEVEKMFRRVIDDVLDATSNKQESFVYGSLTAKQDFYFRPQWPAR
jgi:hypothetical protein